MDIEGLKLKEISLFLDLVKTKSVRELARQRGEDPGQISKTVRALENKIGGSLIHRSHHGITLTPHATKILPYLEKIRACQEGLQGHHQQNEPHSTLSIATTSFFSSHFVPQIMGKIEAELAGTHCRVIDLPPNQFIPVALRNGFEVCIHLGDLEWPKTWSSLNVGQIQWLLCGRPGHPVLARPVLEEILKYPFVYPVYWSVEGLRDGNDNCPIPIEQRIKGFETSTASTAAQVATYTNQLAYLPSLIAKPMLAKNQLVAIPLDDQVSESQPVFLTVKSDAIKQKRFLWLKEQCEHLLK